MSDASQGSGWWIASDGRWYPPELHPDYRRTANPQDMAAHKRLASAASPAGSPDTRRRAPSVTLVIAIVVVVLVAVGVAIAATGSVRGGVNTGQAASVRSSARNDAQPATDPSVPPPSVPGISTTSASAVPSPTSTSPSTTTTSLPASAAATLPEPYAGSGPANSLVTTAVEQRVVSSTWRGFSYQMVANNLDGLSRYATTNARLAVRGSLLCGCLPWPMAYTHVSYSAPPQKTYPASFLAEFSGIDYQQKTFFRDVIFTQASKDAPWLVASTGTYEAPQPLLTPTSHVVAAPPPAPQLTAAPASFAGFFQQLDTTGTTSASVPAGFTTSPLLTSLVQGSTEHYATFQSEGVKRTTAHGIEQVGPRFAFPLSADPGVTATYECFFMSITTTYVAPPGKVLLQTTNRVVWTALLGPGTYSPLREDEEKDVCVVEGSSKTNVELLTTLGGPIRVSGTPATGTPVTTTPT